MFGQPQERALVDRIGAAFATLFFGVQMLVVAEAGHAMPGIPILALLATPFAFFALTGVARIWIEDHGVRIVNVGRTFAIAWEDIERFTLGRHGVIPRVGIAEMRDGRRVAMWGIQGPNAQARRNDVAAQRLITALNAELDRRRLSVAVPHQASVEPAEQYAVASR